MTSLHMRGETISRSQTIEKITTADLEVGRNDFDAVDEFAPPVCAFDAPLVKREISSTLIEFPDKRREAWREEIKNRVQQHRSQSDVEESPVVNKDAKIAAARTARAQSNRVAVSTSEPALVINLKPNVVDQTAAERLKARALERIERSRRRFDSDIIIEPEFPPIIKDEVPSPPESIAATQPTKNNLTFAPRRVLPAITDDAATNFDSELLGENTESEKRENFAPRLILAQTNIREKAEVEIELDADEIVAESLRSVRKVNKVADPLEEQEIAERLSSANSFQRQSNDDFAPLSSRFAAGALDAGLCAALAFGGFALFIGLPSSLNLQMIWQTIVIFAVVKFLYLTTALILSGTTIGMRVFNLQVVTAENGDALTPVAAVVNSLGYLLTLALGGVGLLTTILSPEKRALHDFCAGTIVTQRQVN